MTSLSTLPFDCSRTCPQAGEKLCRFSSIFRAIGPWKVNSHTVTVQVDFDDLKMLQEALTACGGTWKGWGKFKIFDIDADNDDNTKIVEGYGFRLPGWHYDCILSKSGELSYDNYNGSWGKQEELEKLKVEYTVLVSERAAVMQGWQSQRINGGLVIYHPDGGTITVRSDGVFEQNGFIGSGCHEALMQLGVPGTILETHVKPEYSQVAAEVKVSN